MIHRTAKHDPAASRRKVLPILIALAVTACGGGGGDDPPANGNPPQNGGWTAGMFLPRATFAAQCTAPRTGTDPTTNAPYLDIQGTTLTENNWLRSWSNELYLWYDEILDRNPASYTTPGYFDLLRTTATTASGNPKDKFHFTYPTDQWLVLAQSGVTAGYGAQWAVVSGLPPREIVVAYTQPGSPATAAGAGLQRGATVLAVDGVDVDINTQAGVDVLNAGLFPGQTGETHTFTVRDLGSPASRTVTLQSTNVTVVPVQNVRTIATLTGTVGYLSFTDHVATAEQALIDAIATLRAADVDDVVLDLRYNGGGYLDIASELAYMIAGTVPTAGQTFESLRFNAKHASINPVTGAPLTPVPFHTTARGFSAAAGQALPTLDLPHVYVLTGPGTCSASESIINGLQGVNVGVTQIGSTTCGKPYGFYPADNCGTTYFSIQFQGVNAAGFGDYGDGFSPGVFGVVGGATVPGCAVADDFTHALGDPAEARLAAALALRDGQSCPAPSALAPSRSMISGLSKPGPSLAAVDGVVHKSPWLENRTLGTP